MDWVERINSVMEYIEKNLDGNIDNARIASLFVSPNGMFRRIFANMTGMALSEYIRNRKLTEAVHDIRNTNAKLLDIAVKYGYGSSAAFGTAFKAFHGVSPSLARGSSAQLNSLKPFAFTLILSEKGVKSMKYYNLENAEFIMQCMVNKEHKNSSIRDISVHNGTKSACDGYRAMVMLADSLEEWNMSDAYFDTGDDNNPRFSMEPIFIISDSNLKIKLMKEQAAVLTASFDGARTDSKRTFMSLKTTDKDRSPQDVIVCMDISTMGIMTEATSLEKRGESSDPVMNFHVRFIEDALKFVMCSKEDDIEIYHSGNLKPLIIKSGRLYAAILPVLLRD